MEPAGEPAAVSLLRIKTAFERIEDMQYACDASELNTHHRRTPEEAEIALSSFDEICGQADLPPAMPVDVRAGQGHIFNACRLCSSLTTCRI